MASNEDLPEYSEYDASQEGATWIRLEILIRRYITFIVIGIVILYFVARRIMQRVQDARDRVPINGPAPPPTENISVEEQIFAARLRQQQMAYEAAARDAKLQEELAAKRLSEEIKMRNQREGKVQLDPKLGRKLTDDDSGDENDLKKLPKLPNPNQDRYEPYAGRAADDGSSRYRPSGFRRPKKGG